MTSHQQIKSQSAQTAEDAVRIVQILREKESLLRLQRDLGIALSTTSDLNVALDRLLDTALQLEGVDCGGVYLVNETSGALDLLAHRGLSQSFVDSASHYPADSNRVRLAMAGNPIYQRYSDFPQPLKDEGLLVLAVIPIKCEGRDGRPNVVAVFNLASHTHDELPAGTCEAIKFMAAQFGGVISRVRAETGLRESEEKYRLLVENAGELIAAVDYAGRLLVINNVAASILGGRPEDFIGKTMWNIFPQAAADERMAVIRQVFDSGRECSVDVCTTIQGRLRWFRQSTQPVRDRSGKVTSVLTVGSDITQLKQSEEALRRQLDELTVLHTIAVAGAEAVDEDALIERATQVVGETLYPHNFGVLLLDESPGVLYCHPSYRGEKNLQGKRIPLGYGVTGRVAADGRPRRVLDVQCEPEYLDLDPAVRAELCVPLKVGERTIGVINAESAHPNAFTESDERLLATFAGQLATAIEKVRLFEAERRRRQEAEMLRAESQARAEELAAALAKLEELDRLKDQFIQNVSHELRTPLSIILGYADLLDGGELGPLQADQQAPIAIIARRTRMLKRLVEDLTAMLETQAGRFECAHVDMAELVAAALADFQMAAGKAGLSLRSDLAAGAPPVWGDPAHLRRVLDNLIGNAFKFTPAGGQVLVRLWVEDNHVLLEVADTGPGIPPDKQARIFERFYQVDGGMSRRHGGVGLGLALVKEVVEAHGGQVSVHSVPGQGATFRVVLPGVETAVIHN